MNKGLIFFSSVAMALAACGQNDAANATASEAIERAGVLTAELGGKLEASVAKSAANLADRYKDITTKATALVEQQGRASGLQRAQAADEIRALIGTGGLADELDRAAASLARNFETAFGDIEGDAKKFAQVCAEPATRDAQAACARLSQAGADLVATGDRIRAKLAATEEVQAEQRRVQRELLAKAERLAAAK